MSSGLISEPIEIEKSEISSNLNALIVFIFGMGMYTVIYFGTMYLYLTRSSTSKQRVVPATITILFLCTMFLTGVQWYSTKLDFIDNGDTRDSVYVSLFLVPRWVQLSVDISSFIGFVLADGLLIWRCYFVWNRSFRVISLSLLLIITEIALFLAQTIFQAMVGVTTTNVALADKIDRITSAAYFTAFATSFVTTLLISYRIYSVSKRAGVSGRRFRHIINMVVQSGAVYSLSLLMAAISDVLPAVNEISNTRGIAFAAYKASLANVLAGISATILVARVSVLPTTTTYPSTSIHLSGLQFHACSTDRTDTPGGMEATHSDGVNRNLIVEGLQVNSKVQ